jgi:hypothetical protein
MKIKWKWTWKEENGEADCGIYAISLGYAYAICRCPKYIKEEHWQQIAKSICDVHNENLKAEHALANH